MPPLGSNAIFKSKGVFISAFTSAIFTSGDITLMPGPLEIPLVLSSPFALGSWASFGVINSLITVLKSLEITEFSKHKLN